MSASEMDPKVRQVMKPFFDPTIGGGDGKGECLLSPDSVYGLALAGSGEKEKQFVSSERTSR